MYRSKVNNPMNMLRAKNTLNRAFLIFVRLDGGISTWDIDYIGDVLKRSRVRALACLPRVTHKRVDRLAAQGGERKMLALLSVNVRRPEVVHKLNRLRTLAGARVQGNALSRDAPQQRERTTDASGVEV